MTATLQTIATAVQRVQAAFKRRPEAGLHDDPPALSQWQGGTRVVTSCRWCEIAHRHAARVGWQR